MTTDRGFLLDEFANRNNLDLAQYHVEHYPSMMVLWPLESGRIGYEIDV